MAGVVTEMSFSLTDPLVQLYLSFREIFPGLVAAIIILIIGWVIAVIIGHAIKVLLEKIGLDRRLAEAKLSKVIGHMKLSSLLGEIVKWYIFVIFLSAAADVLRLGALSVLLSKFVSWLPDVIAAIIVIVFGLYIAHFVAMKIEEHSKVKGITTVSSIVKILITFIFAIIALEQIGIDVSILRNTFLIIVGGIALAIGLSFGLGTKAEAANALKQLKKYL